MHMQHNAEPLEFAQHYSLLGNGLGCNVRVQTASSGTSFAWRRSGKSLGGDVHANTSIANQVVRISKLSLQTCILGGGKAGLPDEWGDERVLLTGGVQVPMPETIGDGISTPLGLGAMFDYDDGIALLVAQLWVRSDPGIVKTFASMTIGAGCSMNDMEAICK